MGNALQKPGKAAESPGLCPPTQSRCTLHAPSTQPSTFLEDRLAAVIQEKASAGVSQVKFNRLLLKFPTLYAGFAKCKQMFTELDADQDGVLGLEELKQCCAKLGYRLSDEELERTFDATDLGHQHTLNVREFIIAIAILHILQGPGDVPSIDPDILRTFQTSEDAFLCFSSSKHGYIDKAELLHMMHESGTEWAHRSDEPSSVQSVVAQRFAELDIDGDGRISFLEFLLCLEGWVIDAEDDEDILAS